MCDLSVYYLFLQYTLIQLVGSFDL